MDETNLFDSKVDNERNEYSKGLIISSFDDSINLWQLFLASSDNVENILSLWT